MDTIQNIVISPREPDRRSGWLKPNLNTLDLFFFSSNGWKKVTSIPDYDVTKLQADLKNLKEEIEELKATSYIIVLPFDGFTIDAPLIDSFSDNEDGKIVYLEHQSRFAYAVLNSTGSFDWYKDWSTRELYQSDIGIINSNVIFECGGHKYSSVGGVLMAYVRSYQVTNIKTVTQEEYDALGEYDSTTFYIILEE